VSKRKTIVIYSDNDKKYMVALKKKFPKCKGTYPDCPETPSDDVCKTCPVYIDQISDRRSIGFY